MILRLLFSAALLLTILVMGLFGGGGLLLDQAVVAELARWRLTAPSTTSALILLTHLGGSPALLTFTALAAILVGRRDWRAALALASTVLSGRLAIELIKLAVNRPRPALDEHPVSVFSQSFPSGHAGNTMMTYGAIALFALPERWRAPGLAVALALSLSIGATRPVLGVHWPSDVIGGWCLGALWLIGSWSLWERVRRA